MASPQRSSATRENPRGLEAPGVFWPKVWPSRARRPSTPSGRSSESSALDVQSTFVTDEYLEAIREMPQVVRPADVVIHVDCRGRAEFPGQLDNYHEGDLFVSVRVVDDRAC